MREIFKVMKANIRSGKSNFISIIILMFIVSLTLTTVLTVNLNSSKRDSEALEEAGFGDLWAAFLNHNMKGNGTEVEQIVNKIDACKETGKVLSTSCLFANIKDLNGHMSDGNVLLQKYNSNEITYQVYTQDGRSIEKNPGKLGEGEIAVPISLRSLYDCELGDTLYININGEKLGFKVKYFFEDPFMGSSMMGIKTLLISDKDMDTLWAASAEIPDGTIKQGTVLNIFMSDGYNLSATKFQQALNKQTSFTAYAYITLSASQAASYMLILVNIFSAILIAFIILLLIAALIVIGHNINHSIEQDYINIGILKAIGFTNAKLKKINMIQYFLSVLIGGIIGIPAAIPVIGLINEMTKPITCLQVSGKIPLIPCLGILGIILLLVICYVFIKLTKIKRITPVQAITGGQSDIYFKSLLQLPVKKRGIDFWLAYRQLTSNLKQYISACIIAGILVFFLSMVTSMSLWIGEDGKNLDRMFNAFDEDIGIQYYNDSVRDEVEEKLTSYSEIKNHFQMWSEYMLIEGCQTYGYVCDSPEVFDTVLSGRTCLYDNEILITEFLAEELNIGIGDTAEISVGDSTQKFIISGVYQCANDMGSNFAMNTEGYKRLTGAYPKFKYDIYNLKDNRDINIEKIISEIGGAYSQDDLKISAGGIFDGMQSIVAAVRGISLIVYVIAVIFVIITVFIMCTKIFVRERKDYGIYKAVGFTSKRIRIQFSLRFLLIAGAGTLLGLVLNVCLTGTCIGFLFSFMGISEFSEASGILPKALPALFMIVIFFVFSYLLSGKIKKVKISELISE